MSRGFTLIELLVVIAIIGLLSSVVLVSLDTARIKARDTKRLSELNSLRSALELYYSDHGHYPNVSNWAGFENVYAATPVTNPNAANLAAALAPYMAPLRDPKNIGGDSGTLYIHNGTDYCILLWRNPENMKNYPTNMHQLGRCGTVNASGQCSSGHNAIYYGTGGYAAGC